MAGAYCNCCGHRCFVYRIIPDGSHKDWARHLATCAPGMEHDRRENGHDHTTAINPLASSDDFPARPSHRATGPTPNDRNRIVYKKPALDSPLADLRSAFAAEIAALARKHKDAGQNQVVTNTGHTVLFTGMWGDRVEAIDITAPDGHRVRRADGWKIGKTEEVAAFLWDVMEQDRTRAAERERLAGLKSVSITSADAAGHTPGRTTSRYHLTPEQLAQILALAEYLAAANAAGCQRNSVLPRRVLAAACGAWQRGNESPRETVTRIGGWHYGIFVTCTDANQVLGLQVRNQRDGWHFGTPQVSGRSAGTSGPRQLLCW